FMSGPWRKLSTRCEASKVAARYLAAPHRVITIVGDASRISGPLGQLGIGKVVVQKR
ncbi:MAG: hypothetical protein K0S65_1748, partial [Labilithrix sp.]|nr:hypothetical protein [Labilithrix sp.]